MLPASRRPLFAFRLIAAQAQSADDGTGEIIFQFIDDAAEPALVPVWNESKGRITALKTYEIARKKCFGFGGVGDVGNLA